MVDLIPLAIFNKTHKLEESKMQDNTQPKILSMGCKVLYMSK